MLHKSILFLALLAVLAFPAPTSITSTDPGFEAPALGAGKYAYRPAGSSWTFTGSAALASNGSAFSYRNPPAPQGQQVAVLQNAGAITQAIPAWAAGSYQVSFQAALRADVASNQAVRVLVDGVPVGTIAPSTTTYQAYYTPTFQVATGDHTLGFQGTAVSGDNTAFLDAVQVIVAGTVAPKVGASATVATSGKMIGFTFTSIATGQPVTPSQILTPPTVTVNGQPLGPLGTQWVTGYHPVVLLATPGGYQIRPGDTVRVTAPLAWASTPAGFAQALTGTIAENRAGRPMLATESLARTLRIGINNNQSPTSTNLGFYWPLKNLKYRIGWPPGNRGRMAPLGNSSLPIAHNGMPNGLDSTKYPGMAGLWLVMWDASNPATPAQFAISTATPIQCTVTERVDLARAPPDGIGMTRVFDIQPIAGAPSADFDVSLTYADPAYTGTPNYSNLWICQPGDFDVSNGATVLDRSDPWAISRIYLDRVGSGVGSMRWVDSTITGGNPKSVPYPELLSSGSDENWGDLSFVRQVYGYRSIGPVDVTTTPYIYSPFFRQPSQQFTATLAVPISTVPAPGTHETWTFSDGDTAPLMAGLEITADGETCRILGGSGQNWAVYRGSNGTTPATHLPGPLAVSGRRPITDVLRANGGMPGTLCTQLTTASPHGRTTGHTISCDGSGWPQISYTNGSTWNVQGFSRPAYVTGPNTLFIAIGASGTGGVPAQTYPLNPAVQQWDYRAYGGVPIEVAASVTGRFAKADFHANVPIDACDDMVYEIARRVLANFPAGRRVYVEYSNEPWNWAYGGYYFHTALMGPLTVPGNPYPLAHYAFRAGQVHTIFRAVFGAAGRAAEIQSLVNCQMGSGTSQVTPYLELGLKLGTPFDAVAVAPYWSLEDTPLNRTVAAKLDDEQLIDVIMADQRSNPRTNNAWMASVTSAVYGYNQAHGANVKLIGYEGGIETAYLWDTARNRDLLYHPNWYHAELDWIAWCQQTGLERLNIYNHAMWWNPQGWGGYHTAQQRHSRGDGLNGAANNLLWRRGVRPVGGNQDQHVDAVRPQAWLDWLGTINP